MADKACYTTACTCNFLEALVVELPKSVFQTAIYTKSDGPRVHVAQRVPNPQPFPPGSCQWCCPCTALAPQLLRAAHRRA
jgi:hypothetical protein